MSVNNESKFSNKALAFIDYKPAELRINTQWLIVYYTKNPVTKLMERQRITPPILKSKTERLKLAKKIVLEINKKLEKGEYYTETGSNDFQTFTACCKKFIEHITMEIAKNNRRPDTLKTYNSNINMINKYLDEKGLKLNLMLEFNRQFVVNYLDWLYFERSNGPTTYNNHLTFAGNLINYCIGRGYLKENFIPTIKRKKKEEKKRQILTSSEKTKLKKLEFETFHYFVICMMMYYCFTRRTEMTKLKVRNIFLDEGYIILEKTVSKNKKEESVTIPYAFLNLLRKHLDGASPDDYVFGPYKYKPGNKPIKPKKISDSWDAFQKRHDISKQYQLYSLKDTGITDLLNNGVPALKVRDQARHYDIKITESYAARNKTCDETVRNSEFDF